MHNRRDQVQAHSFMVGRLQSALLRGEPDLPAVPLRRTPIGLVIGCILGVLGIGVVFLIQLLHPGGGTTWAQPGTLVVEKETGNRYVLADGRLRPVLNYASARLLLGADLKVESVSAKTLQNVPRGSAVGIVGAPDVLPASAGDANSPWLVCATQLPDSTGVAKPAAVLRVGGSDQVQALPESQGVLVRAEDGGQYLLWTGSRLKLRAGWVAQGLDYAADAAVPVRTTFLDAMPAGPDLGSIQVADAGAAGPALDGQQTTVGQLFAVADASGDDTGKRFFLLTSNGLLPVGATGAQLVLADPASAKAYGGRPAAIRELSAAALASASVLPAPSWLDELPAKPPQLLDAADRMPCVQTVPGSDGRPTVRAATAPSSLMLAALSTSTSDAATSAVSGAGASTGGDAVVGPPGQPGTSGARRRDSRVADGVDVAPGGGMLVRTLAAPGAPGLGLYLVTEDGARYPLGGTAAAEDLGYTVDQAVTVPADLLALLPSGPVLDRLRPGGDASTP